MLLFDNAKITAQDIGELACVKFLVAVGHAGVHAVGHHAVFVPHIAHVVGCTALGKIDGAVHAHIFHGFVIVAVVYHKPLAQVDFLASLAQNFVFKEGVGRIAPACT